MRKAVEIQIRGLTLRGMLHVPENVSGKIPVVCIYHGFTGNRMEPHFIFVKLSGLLEKKGIASVRFDFAGSGESDGEFLDMTLSKEVEDAKAILDYAKSLDFADRSRLGAVGLSMGGAVASIIAGDCREDIKALCLWAPAGTLKDLILQGKSQEELDKIRETGYSDVGGLALGYGFMEDLLELDIYGRAALYDKNVLLLHGDRDQTVPLLASEKYLEIYGIRGSLHVVEGGDHTFNSLEQEREVLDYTAGFLTGELF